MAGRQYKRLVNHSLSSCENKEINRKVNLQNMGKRKGNQSKGINVISPTVFIGFNHPSRNCVLNVTGHRHSSGTTEVFGIVQLESNDVFKWTISGAVTTRTWTNQTQALNVTSIARYNTRSLYVQRVSGLTRL